MNALAWLLALLPPQEPAAARWPASVDVDGDGTAEVRAMHLHASVAPADSHAPLVVLLVEQRLLEPAEGVAPALTAALASKLTRWCNDLAAEGRRVEWLDVACYAGPRHQDGRIVLALRRALAARAAQTAVAAVVLVGHFPDALLLRTCNWRRSDAIDLANAEGQSSKHAPYLRSVPENVAWKCDLVLGDLDGDWESRYFETEQALPSWHVAFGGPVPDTGGKAVAWRREQVRFRDAFHLADGGVELDPATGVVRLDLSRQDAECARADHAASNCIAQPEIAVSRIDARGVAWRGSAPNQHADAAFELQLLGEYFDCNHRFRTEPFAPATHRPASAAFGLPSGFDAMCAANAAWQGFAEPGYDLRDAVDLEALQQWWQRPAVLRTLRAHSDPFAAVFAQGRAGHAFYAALHAGGIPAAQPHVLLHTGCEAISPTGATSLAYHDPRYGRLQHAESVLFFTRCVALVGRAKVFYDEPRGFSATLAGGGTVGDAWREYFARERASSWEQAGGDIGRKRAYFWSVLGDATVSLPKP